MKRKTKRQPFRVVVKYRGMFNIDKDALIRLCADREEVGGGQLLGEQPERDLEFAFGRRLTAVDAAKSIKNGCRGVRVEVYGRIWP